jgi:hypothetical protein
MRVIDVTNYWRSKYSKACDTSVISIQSYLAADKERKGCIEKGCIENEQHPEVIKK